VRKKKHRLTKWSVVFHPKDQGGLGVHDIKVKNRALLGKWLARLLTHDGVWQNILGRKYGGSNTISQVTWKSGDSHFWAGLMATKKYFFPYGSLFIRDELEIRFWEDILLGTTTLREHYPTLYNIARHKRDTLQKMMETSPPSMAPFRRILIGPRLAY
jgi:hypothetical protein